MYIRVYTYICTTIIIVNAVIANNESTATNPKINVAKSRRYWDINELGTQLRALFDDFTNSLPVPWGNLFVTKC